MSEATPGEHAKLRPIGTVRMWAGDVFIIETPGRGRLRESRVTELAPRADGRAVGRCILPLWSAYNTVG